MPQTGKTLKISVELYWGTAQYVAITLDHCLVSTVQYIIHRQNQAGLHICCLLLGLLLLTLAGTIPNACPRRRCQMAAMKVNSRVSAATALVEVVCSTSEAGQHTSRMTAHLKAFMCTTGRKRQSLAQRLSPGSAQPRICS